MLVFCTKKNLATVVARTTLPKVAFLSSPEGFPPK
jgi:hypothetical protein